MSKFKVGDLVRVVVGDEKKHVVTEASEYSALISLDGIEKKLFDKDIVPDEDTWLTDRYLHIEMPDGSTWRVPLGVIAVDRADHYKEEFDNDLVRSLLEDTIPLFIEDDYEIRDWAANNMNWDDVEMYAEEIPVEKPPVDYQEGWVNGQKRVCKLNTDESD